MTLSIELTEVELYSVIAGARFASFARALDSKDWRGYQALYRHDGELRLPWGEPIPHARLAEETRANLGGFAATHHLISNALAAPDGDRMTVTANLHAVHVHPEGSGKAAWVSVARYDAELVLTDGVWLFGRVALTPVWHDGDVPAH